MERDIRTIKATNNSFNVHMACEYCIRSENPHIFFISRVGILWDWPSVGLPSPPKAPEPRAPSGVKGGDRPYGSKTYTQINIRNTVWKLHGILQYLWTGFKQCGSFWLNPVRHKSMDTKNRNYKYTVFFHQLINGPSSPDKIKSVVGIQWHSGVPFSAALTQVWSWC